MQFVVYIVILLVVIIKNDEKDCIPFYDLQFNYNEYMDKFCHGCAVSLVLNNKATEWLYSIEQLKHMNQHELKLGNESIFSRL